MLEYLLKRLASVVPTLVFDEIDTGVGGAVAPDCIEPCIGVQLVGEFAAAPTHAAIIHRPRATVDGKHVTGRFGAGDGDRGRTVGWSPRERIDSAENEGRCRYHAG